jgi:thiol-disulfide isomerase/thioredoxin
MKFAIHSLLFTVVVLGLTPLMAQPAGPASVDGSGQIQTLIKQVDDALAAYLKGQDDQHWEAYYHLNDATLPKVFELAKQNPGSKTSFDAFAWIITNRRLSVEPLRAYGTEALALLLKYHTGAPNIGQICRTLGNNWDPADASALDFLQLAAEKNPDRPARAFATLALGRFLKQRMEDLQMFPLRPSSTNQWWLEDNARYQAERETADVQTLFEQAVKALKTVQSDYADCPDLPPQGAGHPRPPLGDQAAVDLFELTRLTLGREVPEVSSQDVEGHDLKLSQFRGKVVLLNFWATWCGPCMQMVPLERALAERYKGRPFALLGVNGDSTQEAAKATMQKEQMTWPSFWNSDVPGGNLADNWNIRGWPTFYVLDPNGIIRFKGMAYAGLMTSNQLTQIIDQVLAETAKSKAETAP